MDVINSIIDFTIKWILPPVTVLVAFIMWAARTGPEAAKENLSGWFTFLARIRRLGDTRWFRVAGHIYLLSCVIMVVWFSWHWPTIPAAPPTQTANAEIDRLTHENTDLRNQLATIKVAPSQPTPSADPHLSADTVLTMDRELRGLFETPHFVLANKGSSTPIQQANPDYRPGLPMVLTGDPMPHDLVVLFQIFPKGEGIVASQNQDSPWPRIVSIDPQSSPDAQDAKRYAPAGAPNTITVHGKQWFVRPFVNILKRCFTAQWDEDIKDGQNDPWIEVRGDVWAKQKVASCGA